MAELPLAMLRLMADLVPNIFSTYNEINLRTRSTVLVYHPAEWRARHEAIMPQLVAALDQHPIFHYVQRTGDGSTRFISDFIPEPEWLKTDFGRVSASIGIRATATMCLHTSTQASIAIALSRGGDPFTERDRQVSEILRPHLTAAYDNASAFTAARALALLSTRAMDESSHGVALTDAFGRLLHLNARGRDLLERLFPAERGWQAVLPAAIRQWLQRQESSAAAPRLPFELLAGDRKLVVRATQLAADRRLVLLQEIPAAADPQRLRVLGLSAREAEVLHWMAEGKTNADIAAILKISPRTVEKHIETIYGKLGVETRTAALLKAVSVG